jgi:nicotinate-nucleotide pyrophosphorylase (carboxylating)
LDPDEDLVKRLHAADITSAAALPELGQRRAQIVAKQVGIIAGLPVAEVVFRCLDSSVDFRAEVEDGQAVSPGEVLVEMEGNGRGLLTAERTALNFLGAMSGTATLVGQFVAEVSGTGARILDTRKTTPGQRRLQKYAVRMGGGTNHRMGLYDMALVKDNHSDSAGGIEQAVARVRAAYGDRYPIEVEVRDLEELRIALALDLDRILLDNMDLEQMRQAVAIAAGRTPLEASGNVNLETVRVIAETGVDFISIGALTHSAPNFDLSMRIL